MQRERQLKIATFLKIYEYYLNFPVISVELLSVMTRC